MQFVRFKHEGLVAYGILEGGLIYEIRGSMYDEFSKTGKVFSVADVKFLYPCEPTNIYCVGLNFQSHIDELRTHLTALTEDTLRYPASFMKPVSGVIHPEEQIRIPDIAQRVDYEGEMALIIRDRISNVPVEHALDHVFGITPLNDVTERELGYIYTQVTYCKSFDTFTSFGPVIDTSVDPDNTVVRTYLNGTMVQEGATSDFLFSCAQIVSYFSQNRTLFPGDVISTGTPRNVLEIKDGDKVDVEIEGIDTRLVNYVYDPRNHR